MGLPVKLSDDLVVLARAEAEAAQRSIAGQVEHWARVGRAVEQALAHADTLALKRGAPLEETFPEAGKRAAVWAMLEAIAGTTDRPEARDRVRSTQQPVYGTDPRYPGQVVRIDPDGTRVPGRFENRGLVPLS